MQGIVVICLAIIFLCFPIPLFLLFLLKICSRRGKWELYERYTKEKQEEEERKQEEGHESFRNNEPQGKMHIHFSLYNQK